MHSDKMSRGGGAAAAAAAAGWGGYHNHQSATSVAQSVAQWTAPGSNSTNAIDLYNSMDPSATIVETVYPPTQLPLLTPMQLTVDSPSVRAGMPVAQEARCRQQACALLRSVCEILRLEIAPTVTALTVTLRFYAKHSYAVHSPEFVVPAALYVASKLEEAPRRISDIVNVVRRVLYPQVGDPEVVRLSRIQLDFAEVGRCRLTLL